jgi:hypothetical protein
MMKKLASICAGLLFLLSTPVFAEDHLVAAQQHVNAAVVHGEAGHTQILIEHAKAALEQTLAASIVAKGVSKNHLDSAAKELQESIDLANLGHVGAATIHAEAAEKHIKASNK